MPSLPEKRGRSMRGWALVGAAALFRLECLVLAAALLLCGGVCRESGKNDLKWWLRTALCLSPGVAWNVFAILHGAHVQGFDFFSFPSPHRICVASESAFASVLFLRNGLVPLCLVAIAVAISIVHGERILARKWLLACFAALLAGIASWALTSRRITHGSWTMSCRALCGYAHCLCSCPTGIGSLEGRLRIPLILVGREVYEIVKFTGRYYLL